MKLKHLAVLSLTAAAAFATSAMAADPTVTFKGEVFASACTPKIGGSTNGEVKLKKITESMFPGVGKTAGLTQFHIDVTGCGDALNGKTVKAYFYQNGATHGRLIKSTGDGSGWTYQLLNKAANKIIPAGNVGTGIAPNDDDVQTAVASGGVKLTYHVRYYRESANVVLGALNAQANYVLYHD